MRVQAGRGGDGGEFPRQPAADFGSFRVIPDRDDVAHTGVDRTREDCSVFPIEGEVGEVTVSVDQYHASGRRRNLTLGRGRSTPLDRGGEGLDTLAGPPGFDDAKDG